MDEVGHSLPENQVRNLFNDLDADVNDMMNINADLTRPRAFMLATLNWLGIQVDGNEETETENLFGKVIDGAGDGGIDFYALSDESVDIYQFKGSERTISESHNDLIAPSQITDLSRILNLLKNIEDDTSEQNQGLRTFKRTLRTKIRHFYDSQENEQKSFQIRIFFVAAGKNLSDQAEAEYLRVASETEINILEKKCEISFERLFANDIIQRRWMETNSTWRDVTGKNRDYFECNLMPLEHNLIDDNKCRIFFAKAYDLIQAYDSLGHRIFESNVRCKLKSSSVNKKIAESIGTEKGIKEFHLLNNGVTVCANSISIRNGRARFTKPGIVNGLQTITTLHSAYKTLSDSLKRIFRDECYVLVRSYHQSANNSEFIAKLVVATNNQNPMEPRNLRSNEPTQIALEKSAARLGWFYERKQFAWDAFSADTTNWSTLKGKRKSDFTIGNKKRVLDNVIAAQCWLAFIGFPKEAMNEKNNIFLDNTGKRVYDLIFQHSPISHSRTHRAKFGYNNLMPHFKEDATPANCFLLSYLLFSLYKEITPSRNALRLERVNALSIENKTHQEQEQLLAEDTDWFYGLVKLQMPYMFVDLAGYLLFKKFGESFFDNVDNILRKTDLSEILHNLNHQIIRDNHSRQAFGKNSFFLLTYSLFSEIVDQLVRTAWLAEYKNATAKRSLVLSDATRDRIFKYIDDWEPMIKNGHDFMKPWSTHCTPLRDLTEGIVNID